MAPSSPVRSITPSSTAFAAFREELVLVSARKWNSLAALRAGTPRVGPDRAGVSAPAALIASGWSRCFSEFGWPSAARFELGTLDGMIGCVAADIGVTMLPRAVVERDHVSRDIAIHALNVTQSRVDTLFIQRRSAHQYSALQGFVSCLDKTGHV